MGKRKSVDEIVRGIEKWYPLCLKLYGNWKKRRRKKWIEKEKVVTESIGLKKEEGLMRSRE